MVVGAARLVSGMDVLDLASGSGEPALTAARMVGPRGHVTATDISSEMLLVAEENAKSLGLTNMSFHETDSQKLPFQGKSFDAATCRLGVTFFPDLKATLGEVHRVLRPGGRVSLLTWGPQDQNPRFTTTFGVLQSNPTVGAKISQPGLFRYDSPEALVAPLIEAGFKEVSGAYHSVPFPWDGPVGEAWECFRELSAPFQRLFAQVPLEDQVEVTKAMLSSMGRYYDGRKVNFTATVVLASCTR